jgi:hypothetical protein
LHLSPQVQPFVSPVVFVFWQPHLQAAPAQDAHIHCFDFIDIGISFSSELVSVGLRQQLECRIGTTKRDCMKQLFSMNESAI